MNPNATKMCPGCGQGIDAINFTCPICKTVQTAGALSLRTRKPTVIVAGAGPMTMRRPLTIPVVERRRPNVNVAVVTFNDDAEVVVPLSPVEQVGAFPITPDGRTNGAAAFAKADEILHGDPGRIYRKSAVVMLSDGDFTFGGGGFLGFGGNPAEAAIKESKALQAKGTRVGSILFSGDESARESLKGVASSPSLFMEAANGQLMKAMLSLTRTMTQAAGSASESTRPGMAVVFLIDSSGSMGEGSKKSEAEAAFLRCVEDLRAM